MDNILQENSYSVILKSFVDCFMIKSYDKSSGKVRDGLLYWLRWTMSGFGVAVTSPLVNMKGIHQSLELN